MAIQCYWLTSCGVSWTAWWCHNLRDNAFNWELPWQQASALLMWLWVWKWIFISSCLENDSAMHSLWWRESDIRGLSLGIGWKKKKLPSTFVRFAHQAGLEENVSFCLVTIMYLQFDHMTCEWQDERAFCIMSAKSYRHWPQADGKGIFALVMMNQGWRHSRWICRAWLVLCSQHRSTWSTCLHYTAHVIIA